LSELDWAELIRELRGRLGLTQERFAARLGVSFPTINRWENGRSVPSPLAQQRMEQILRGLKGEGKDLLDRFLRQGDVSTGGNRR